VSSLICGGVATTGAGGTQALAIGQIVQLNSILDAQGYGLNDAYDAANSILVYHHIKRFFKRCPSATLYLVLMPQRIAPVVAVSATVDFEITVAVNGSHWSAAINTLALVGAPVALSTTSTSSQAVDIVDAINAYTGTSGCTANATGSGFTVTLPSALGATLNTVVPVITETGGTTSTATAATGGVTGVTGGAVKLSDMLDITNEYAAYMLRSVLSTRAAAKLQGGIRQLGAVLNPDAAALAAETAVSGLSDDTSLAVAKAQALADYAYAAFYPVDILVEGRYFNATPTAAINARGLGSGQVSLVIGADPAISTIDIGGDHPYQHYAAVGDALGCMAQCKVDESIGNTSLNLTDTADGSFVTAGLSSGLGIDNYSAGVVVGGRVVTGLDTLYDKGYIIPRIIPGLDGIYWGGGPTCTAIDQDDAWSEDSRTLNKASIYVRRSFLKEINATVPVGPNGAILPTKVAQLQDAAEKMLDQYMAGEISGRKVTITTTDVNGNPINFVQSGEIIPYVALIEINGVARSIDGTISLVSSLS
jgi:hypothetical protein